MSVSLGPSKTHRESKPKVGLEASTPRPHSLSKQKKTYGRLNNIEGSLYKEVIPTLAATLLDGEFSLCIKYS